MKVELIQNRILKQTELHIGGEFVAGWKKFKLPDDIESMVCQMIEKAFQEGERKRSRDILDLLST